MNFNSGNNAFMQDKLFLEDMTNIVENCTPKCIKDYTYSNLSTKEQQCLEKCYFKSLAMNQKLSDNFGDLMTRINESS